MFLCYHIHSACQNLKTKINVIENYLQTFFHVRLFSYISHIFTLLQKLKKSVRWEKSVRAQMINRGIFLSGLRAGFHFGELGRATKRWAMRACAARNPSRKRAFTGERAVTSGS